MTRSPLACLPRRNTVRSSVPVPGVSELTWPGWGGPLCDPFDCRENSETPGILFAHEPLDENHNLLDLNMVGLAHEHVLVKFNYVPLE